MGQVLHGSATTAEAIRIDEKIAFATGGTQGLGAADLASNFYPQ